MKKLQTLFIFSAILLSVAFTQAQISVDSSSVQTSQNATACSKDAFSCPDGSTVGRVAPTCQFAACPGQAAQPRCTDLKNNLYLRSTDSRTNGEVSLLQTFLTPTYFSQVPSGYFGRITLAAVQRFQSQNGIISTGYVGPMTRAKIKEVSCTTAGVVPTPTPLAIASIAPLSAAIGSGVTLSGPGLNAGGDYILFDGVRIETDGSKALNRIGFFVPEYLAPDVPCTSLRCPPVAVRQVVPGTYTVQVVNRLGTSNIVNVRVTDSTTIVPIENTIKITSVEPSAARAGDSVIVYGYNLFRSETRILFNGTSIRGVPNLNKRGGNFNSSLIFVVPRELPPCDGQFCTAVLRQPVTPGTYELAVDNKLGRDAVKFEVIGTQNNEVRPSISLLAPSQGAIGTEITIRGERINVGGDEIYFGGSLVGQVSGFGTDAANTLRFAVPEFITPCGVGGQNRCRIASVPVAPGTYEVAVVNKNGTSNTFSFTVTSKQNVQPAPTLTRTNPGNTGRVGDIIGIVGNNISTGFETILLGGNRVEIIPLGDMSLQGVRELENALGVSASTLYFRIPSGTLVGATTIQVRNANGSSNSLPFTVLSSTNTSLTISSVTPTSATIGSGVTLSGPGLNAGGDYILFDGMRIETDGSKVLNRVGFFVPEYLTSNVQCTALQCPPVAVRAVVPGTYTVQVVNRLGASNIVNMNVVSNVNTSLLVINSISPASGSAGTQVTISGSNLSPTTDSVWFGSLKIEPNRKTTSNTSLVFTVPATLFQCPAGVNCLDVVNPTPLGQYDIKVESANGQISNVMRYQVTGSGAAF